MQPSLVPYRNPIWRGAGAGEPGNDSEAEAHSAMGGGDDVDDVTTEMVGPARTNDAASAMMEAVAKVIKPAQFLKCRSCWSCPQASVLSSRS